MLFCCAKYLSIKNNFYFMTNNIKAAIFDLYGTLISLTEETKPYFKLFLELGLSSEEMKPAREIALSEDFADLSGLVKRIKPNANINLQSYEDEVTTELKSAVLFPETKRVLEKLQERNFRLGLVSNLASPYKKPFFDLGLDRYFDKALFSCEVGLIKPDIRIYQRILQDLNSTPHQALMVGDKINRDVDPPKSIGMNAVLIDRNNQYKPSIRSLEEIFQYC